MKQAPDQVGKPERPQWIRSNTIEEKQLTFEGKSIPYVILKKELAPQLPGFLGYRKDGDYLFISEEVPEEYRELQLVHELMEYTDPALKEQPGRCLEALKREIALVPEEMKTEYLRYRRRLFQTLASYYEASENPEERELREEIVKSRDYLDSLNL